MYRIFIFITALMFIYQPAFAQRTIATRQPYYHPYYNKQTPYYNKNHVPRYYRYGKQTASQFSDISDLEKYALNKNFCRENDRARLERLELQAFGAVQSGDFNTRYNNVRNAILSRPKQNYKTSVLRSLGDYFGGQMTGFTPSIYPQIPSYDTYPNSYGKSSATGYVSPWHKGFKTNNYGISSSSGVHILD